MKRAHGLNFTKRGSPNRNLIVVNSGRRTAWAVSRSRYDVAIRGRADDGLRVSQDRSWGIVGPIGPATKQKSARASVVNLRSNGAIRDQSGSRSRDRATSEGVKNGIGGTCEPVRLPVIQATRAHPNPSPGWKMNIGMLVQRTIVSFPGRGHREVPLAHAGSANPRVTFSRVSLLG